MGLPKGQTIKLTPLRRFMTDMMRESRRIPLVAIERRMLLAEVIAARQQAIVRPSWFAIFMKAYGLISVRRPTLRQSFLTWPTARLHQHACTVATLAVARQFHGENGVFAFQIREPQTMSLLDIDARIRAARTEPIEHFGDYRRQLRLANMPGPLRRLAWWAGLNVSGDWRARYVGTFGLTGISALGATTLSLLSPLTSTLTYGVFAEDGSVTVRLYYDHRVLDGIEPAHAMEDLEAVLHGDIRVELLDHRDQLATPSQAARFD